MGSNFGTGRHLDLPLPANPKALVPVLGPLSFCDCKLNMEAHPACYYCRLIFTKPEQGGVSGPLICSFSSSFSKDLDKNENVISAC